MDLSTQLSVGKKMFGMPALLCGLFLFCLVLAIPRGCIGPAIGWAGYQSWFRHLETTSGIQTKGSPHSAFEEAIPCHGGIQRQG